MNEPFVPFRAQTGELKGVQVLTTEYRGVLRVEERELVLEFTSRRMIVGGGGGVVVIGTGNHVGPMEGERGGEEVQTVRVPLEHVGSLELRGGFFLGPRLHIEVNRVRALAAVPWSSGVQCTVRLARRDARRARELALELRLRLADAQLRRLGETDFSDT